MGASRRFRPRVIDIRSDFHGHILDYVCGDDRRWFEDNPGEPVRWRPAPEHEFCDPGRFPDCRPLFPTPEPLQGDKADLWVEVRYLVPGCRTRTPYIVIGPGVAA